MDKSVTTNSFPNRAISIRDKNSGQKSTNPIAMKKEFGDKNLGQVLNEVADPNYKAAKTKVRGVGNNELNKDAFFKLMLAQLKQQDPTNPLKSHEMAAQLAQFSSVEQLSNMNETLTKMSQADGNQKFDVLSLIGKKVSGDSSEIDRKKGDKNHTIEFNLADTADKGTVSIKDEKGTLVKKYELKDLKKGRNQLVWNGLHSDGKDARVGSYTAQISAQNRGQKVTSSTRFTGAVDGVKYSAQGPVLMVDGKSLNLKDVKMIEMMKPESETSVKNLIKPDSIQSQGAVLAKGDGANLDTAKMDKELRQRLQGKVK